MWLTDNCHLLQAERFGLQRDHIYSVTKLVDVSKWYHRQSKPLIRKDQGVAIAKRESKEPDRAR